MVMGNNKSVTIKNADFNCHSYVAVRLGVHCPMEYAQGFTWSHWMPPLGEGLGRIAPVAVMVHEFVETTLNTNKTQLLPCNYCTFDR
jgi:hypothetical protein